MKVIIDNIYSIENTNPSQECIPYIIDTNSEDGLVVIDPGLYTKFFKELEEYGFKVDDINHCLITHEHLDHYGGCFELKKLNENIKFYAHELAVKQIEQKMELEFIEENYPGYDYDAIEITETVKDNEILKFGTCELSCIHTPGHTPGAVAYILELDSAKILFAGDIGGSALRVHGGNINNYLSSMQKLIDLNVDILCEGHSGVFKPAKNITEFIIGYKEFNKNFQIFVEVDQSNIEALYNTTLKLYELKEFDFALDFCNYLIEIAPDNLKAQILYKKIKSHNPPKVDYIKKVLKRT